MSKLTHKFPPLAGTALKIAVTRNAELSAKILELEGKLQEAETQLAAEKESHRVSIEVINLAWNSYVKADEATRIGMVPVKASGFQALPVRSCGSCGAISQEGTKWVDDGSLYGKRVPVTDPE